MTIFGQGDDSMEKKKRSRKQTRRAPIAESEERRAESKEQRAKSEGQRAESKGQRAKSHLP
jgi:hypothetical protein